MGTKSFFFSALRRRFLFKSGFICLLVALESEAGAVCDITSVTVGSPTLSVTAPFSGSDVAQAFTVTVQAGASGCTGGQLQVRKPVETGTALSNGVVYISSDTTVGNAYINTQSGASEATVEGSLNLASNASQSFTLYSLYRVSSMASQVVSGSYPLNLEFYVGDPTLISSNIGSLNVLISSIASVSINTANGSYNAAQTSASLSFGTLTSNAQMSFYAMVQSTNTYKIDITSAQEWQLENATTAPGGFSAVVPYTVTLDNVLLNPSGTSITVTPASNGATASAGRSHEGRITLGTVSNTHIAGTYEDELTITVTADP